MANYPFHDIEPRWQQYWKENKVFEVTEDLSVPKEKRKYILDMFPYPSGSGLHLGHPEGYTATDIYARFLRMKGYAVLHPIGFDSFGLPAENYAIQTGMHPEVTTMKNIETFRRQIESRGFSYDWRREIITSESDYYQWTQWIFIQLFGKGLAYQSEALINWCGSCKTGLAMEEVKNGQCDRCGHTIQRKKLRQWILKITAYAEELLAGLKDLDWPTSIKGMQENWIGKSKGANIDFSIFYEGHSKTLKVFTTRPDTVYGVTYLLIAPEHPWLIDITTDTQKTEVDQYLLQISNKSDLERSNLLKERSGVFTGAYAKHPLTGKHIPIWIADYVLMSYGTGIVMAVPAHDQRDWEFAKKFQLPIAPVIQGGDLEKEAFTADGLHINSKELDGLFNQDAILMAIQLLEKKSVGEKTVQYKLRDWIFSRQRYWGEPIPIIHCQECGAQPVPEEELPITLPDISNFHPIDTGESPLAAIDDWVNCLCPKCGQPSKRETNTMPQWAGSCWYYLRYLSPNLATAFIDQSAESYWMPVDLYIGGSEHAVLHLLYARFWHRVLYDLKLVSDPEPFKTLVNQGMILGETEYIGFQTLEGTPISIEKIKKISAHETELESLDGQVIQKIKLSKEQLHKEGNHFVLNKYPSIKVQAIAEKMSKSRGNVISPDEIIREYGADTLRVYEMFMGPLEMVKPWTSGGLAGVHRFLNRVWSIGQKSKYLGITEDLVGSQKASELKTLLHQTIKKVSLDTEKLEFNTAISQMMVFSTKIATLEKIPLELWTPFILLLSPYAPHIAEELYQQISSTESTLAYTKWPKWEEALCLIKEREIIFQVNGKLRSKTILPIDSSKETLLQTAKKDPKIKEHISGKNIVKEVVVLGKLVNLVTR